VLNRISNSVFLKVYGPAILWGIFILIATLTPGKSLPSSSLFKFDKLIHISIFGMFAWLVLRAYFLSHVGRTNKSEFIVYAIVCVATILFGISIECMQQFIPDRGADIYDVLANSIGIVCAQVLFYLFHKNK
jgi:VanZ family protein